MSWRMQKILERRAKRLAREEATRAWAKEHKEKQRADVEKYKQQRKLKRTQ